MLFGGLFMGYLHGNIKAPKTTRQWRTDSLRVCCRGSFGQTFGNEDGQETGGNGGIHEGDFFFFGFSNYEDDQDGGGGWFANLGASSVY